MDESGGPEVVCSRAQEMGSGRAAPASKGVRCGCGMRFLAANLCGVENRWRSCAYLVDAAGATKFPPPRGLLGYGRPTAGAHPPHTLAGSPTFFFKQAERQLFPPARAVTYRPYHTHTPQSAAGFVRSSRRSNDENQPVPMSSDRVVFFIWQWQM